MDWKLMKRTWALLPALSIVLAACSNGGNDQALVTASDPVSFAKSYGGASRDAAYCVRETSDGGYLAGGYTQSFGALGTDVMLMKLEADGTLVWQKAFGVSMGKEILIDLQPTADGGGVVISSAVDRLLSSIWVMRFDASGAVVWQKSFGDASHWCWGQSIRLTSDGGCLVMGNAIDLGTFTTDIWVFRLDAAGGMIWGKAYGVPETDEVAYAIVPAVGGGAIVAGYSNMDSLFFRLDDEGAVLWQKTYRDSGSLILAAAEATADGGLVAAGSTNAVLSDNSKWNGAVLRLDGQGNVVWYRTYGGSGNDFLYTLQPTAAGGVVVAGGSTSFGFGPATGRSDFWMLQLDGDGAVACERAIGGPGMDLALSVRATSAGGTVVAGVTDSVGAGDWDCWVLGLDADGQVLLDEGSGMSVIDTACVSTSRSASLSVQDVAAVFSTLKLTPEDTTAMARDVAAVVVSQKKP
jgi:hypothetical protein